MNDKEKQQLGVVLSDSGFSGYLTIHDIIPILDHLYEHFDKSFFVKQIQRFRSVSYTHLDVYKRQS